MKPLRVLFIHQNFPAQFKHLAPWLAARGHQVIALADAHNIAGREGTWPFRVIGYTARAETASGVHHYLLSTENAVRRGQDVARVCIDLHGSGFEPDVVIGHPAWGEMLFIRDTFPRARVVSYFEYFYRAFGGDVGFDPEFPASLDSRLRLRIRNTAQLHALNDSDAGISPTAWQRSTYPGRDQARIRIIHEGLDTERLKPEASASLRLPDGRVLTRSDQVVSFVSRNLEPYRGFHVFMRALPELQRRLPHAHFVIVGSDGVSYGTAAPKPHANYREMLLAEVGENLDAARTHFLGRVPYDDFVRLLQLSRLHIYLSYPFVLSWSMLEAMACGAPVLGSATPPVQEMLVDGETGFLFPFFDQAQLVECAVAILGQDNSALCARARSRIESDFSFQRNSLPAYLQLLRELLEVEEI